MENLERKQNKEKLIKVATTFDKVLQVFKILSIIGIVLFVLAAITFAILGVTGAATKIYELNPELFGKMKISDNKDAFMFLNDEKTVYLREIYEIGKLDMLLYGVAVGSLSVATETVVYLLIMIYLQKVFRTIETNETPFNTNLLKPFKILFIVLTILAIFRYNLFAGILTGGLLACIYFIYAYGCNMQEDEDQTLWLN